jgi:hypothetical protein
LFAVLCIPNAPNESPTTPQRVRDIAEEGIRDIEEEGMEGY